MAAFAGGFLPPDAGLPGEFRFDLSGFEDFLFQFARDEIDFIEVGGDVLLAAADAAAFASRHDRRGRRSRFQDWERNALAGASGHMNPRVIHSYQFTQI
jgi:hypothetical protein